MMIILPRIGLGFGLVAVLACSRSGDRTESPASANDTYQAGKTDEPALQPASRSLPAAESIAEARCARETRCENVGDNKKYSSQADCMARIRSDWKDDLNARECPGGVNQTELQECLGSIRSEECNSPLDTLDRVTECTAASICMEDVDDKR